MAMRDFPPSRFDTVNQCSLAPERRRGRRADSVDSDGLRKLEVSYGTRGSASNSRGTRLFGLTLMSNSKPSSGTCLNSGTLLETTRRTLFSLRPYLGGDISLWP